MKITDTSAQDTVVVSKSNNRPWWFAALAIVTLSATAMWLVPEISNWANTEYSVSRERLRFAKVHRGDLISDLSVQGRVVAAISPRLYSPAQGTITFHVSAGDAVSENQLLASIHSPALTNQLQQEQASLQSLRIELDRQKIQSRQQQLNNQKAIDKASVTLNAADRPTNSGHHDYSG